MHVIHFDFSDHLKVDGFFGYQLRVAYILSDVLNAAGFCANALTFEEVQSSMTIDEKVTMMDKAEKVDEELKELIEIYLDIKKQFKSMKHPPNNVFLNFKKIQNSIGIALNTWELGIKDYFKNTGHSGLLSLCEKGGFDFYYTDEGIESKNRLDPIDLLTNKCPENAIDTSIWSMPSWFYVSNFFEKEAVTDIKSINNKNPYFIKCLDLPNVNFLTITEIDAIKKQVSNEIQDFKTKVDLWAAQCYQTKGGATYFRENLYPTLGSLQEAFDQNPIMKHFASHRGGHQMISLFLGEVTPPTLWKYYLHFKQITDMEYDDLMNGYKRSEKHTIPVLLFMKINPIFKLELLPTEAEIIVPQTEITAVRKHINID